MFFNKKGKDKLKCENCNSKISNRFSFCPFCGNTLIDQEKEIQNFGMLGKDDFSNSQPSHGLGITDKLLGSLVNSLVKSLDKQFRDINRDFEKDLDNAEVKSFPNGIRIKIGSHPNYKKSKKPKHLSRSITEKQLKKISSLPKTEARTNVKRLNNKILYELSTPGVGSTDDVFISKLESGYEVKAIGDRKVYVNSLPINLPLLGFSILKNKLLVEFKTE